MLRILSRKALYHITKLFNHILMLGYFPTAWKAAKVISIPKPGQPPFDPGSHRPINLLRTLSRLLERAVVHRLNSFINQNRILTPEQSGFRLQPHLPEPPISSPMALILANAQT